MTKEEKKLLELEKKLSSSNQLIVTEAVRQLRNSDPFPGAVCLLVKVYNSSSSQSVRDIIKTFLNDLKGSALREEVIAEAMKDHSPDTIAMLVSSCWQSGMDYSDYSRELAEIFNKGDYMTALECLTVLEESVYQMSVAAREKARKILAAKASLHSPEKKVLMNELIKLLS